MPSIAHAFGNGNKRLSVMAFVVFLYIINQALEVPPEALRDKALWLAQTDQPIGDVVAALAQWAEENCIPVLKIGEWGNGVSGKFSFIPASQPIKPLKLTPSTMHSEIAERAVSAICAFSYGVANALS
jgi:hypothetical protein